MRIRQATIKDLQALVELDCMTSSCRDRRSWLRRSIRNRATYVLIEDIKIVAYGVLNTFFQRPFIEMLCVSKSMRRMGYGEQLLRTFEEQIQRSVEIWTSTNRSNRPMRMLLKKRGFRMVGRVTGLDRGDAELFYCKKLRPNAQ